LWPTRQDQTSCWVPSIRIRLLVVAHPSGSDFLMWSTHQDQTSCCGPPIRIRLLVVAHPSGSDFLLWPTRQDQTSCWGPSIRIRCPAWVHLSRVDSQCELPPRTTLPIVIHPSGWRQLHTSMRLYFYELLNLK
jgi:hypothetical protein